MKDEIQGSTDLVTFEANAIVEAFRKDEIDPIVAKIEAEVRSHVSDVTTEKGRKAVRSLAHKVARSKTAIDAEGKKLIEDAQKIVSSVNEKRKAVRDRLDELKAETLKPVEEWEEKDEERKAKHREGLKSFLPERTNHALAVAEIDAIIAEVEAIEIDETWDEFEDMARLAKAEALDKYRADRVTADVRETQERRIAELEAEREARAEADRIAAEKKAAEEAEARRIAEEKARKEEEARQAKEADEKRLQAQADHADSLVEYVGQVAKGFIGGEIQPFGILRYELDTKVPAEKSKVGDHWPKVEAAISEALKAIDAAEAKAAEEQDRLAEEKRQREAEEAEAKRKAEIEEAKEAERKRLADQRAEEEAAAKRRREDDAHRARVLDAISDAVNGIPHDEIAQSIFDGNIPHVQVIL